MVEISEALREKLTQQKKGMESGGTLIKAKTFKKGRFRLLPVHDELPGKEYIQLYAKSLGTKKKGTTSPRCLGVPCPVMDFLDRLYREGEKTDKEFATDFVRRGTEYWLAVIDREDEGTPDNPNVRILPGRKGVYQELVGWMLDEDVGEDITDPMEGRDFIVKKEGSGLETEWSVQKANDRSPISEDEEMAQAWVDLAERFDVRTKFYPVDLEVLNAIYEGLTGEEIPEHYLGPIQELIENGPNAATADDDLADDPSMDAGEEEEEEEETEAGDEEDGWVGTTVKFESDGTEIVGDVVGIDTDEDEGNLLIVEEGEDPEEPWSIPPKEVTVVESEPEQAPEPPPKTSRKKASKKAKTAKTSKASKSSKTASKTPRKPRPGGAAAKIKSKASRKK